MDHYINKKTEWNLAQFPAGMDKYCPDILRAIVSCRVNHHDKLEQFGILRNAVKNNIDDIVEKWNSRWILSIIDTYADLGTDIEKSNATLISHIFNSIRMMESYLELCHHPKMDEQYFQDIKQLPLWDGFLTFNLRYGNTMENCFSRVEQAVKATPILETLYTELLKRTLTNSNIFATLCDMHQNNLIGENLTSRILQ